MKNARRAAAAGHKTTQRRRRPPVRRRTALTYYVVFRRLKFFCTFSDSYAYHWSKFIYAYTVHFEFELRGAVVGHEYHFHTYAVLQIFCRR